MEKCNFVWTVQENFECSHCKEVFYISEDAVSFNYCPNCGSEILGFYGRNEI